ncbi:MAG: hypothetical protein WCD35_04665 [Mycobacteriales bacterium]
MRLAHGVDVSLPSGWQVALRRQRPVLAGREGNLLLHAATVPMPAERGDFGSAVVATLRPHDLFVALVEFDREATRTALFSSHGMPRPRPSEFDPAGMQQVQPGMSGGQWFFSQAGRAWCLYAVLGSHARRQAGALRVNELLRGVRLG